MLQRWLVGLLIGAALLVVLRGIAKDVDFNGSMLRQAFVADAGWMNTTINHIDGTVAYARLGVEWHPWRNAGLMLDYNYTNLRASTDRGALSGRVDLRDSGLRAGLVFRY